jgi:hypothetical protein
MANLDARRRINLRGRLFAVAAGDVDWQPLPDVEGGSYKVLLPPAAGPAAALVRAPAGAALTMPAAPFGRYEIVLDGSVIMGGREIGPPGLRYTCGPDAAEPLVTGSAGAAVAYLTFDADALQGGITDDALALEAAEAMARAI